MDVGVFVRCSFKPILSNETFRICGVHIGRNTVPDDEGDDFLNAAFTLWNDVECTKGTERDDIVLFLYRLAARPVKEMHRIILCSYMHHGQFTLVTFS